MTQHNLSGIKGLILDMDGVLWKDTEPIVNISSVFYKIREQGWKVILATNNATRTVDQYIEIVQDFGVVLKPWQVINSAQATAKYLSDRFPNGGKVFVIGEHGLIRSLGEYGFESSGDDDVLAVVVGMDRSLTYQKLSQATLLIRRGIPFIGTNPDRSFPTPKGLIPGTGALLATLEVASDVKPTIIGKPSPTINQQALERLGTIPAETLVVGDRLETDIAGGQKTGCPTALVLSGVTTLEESRTWLPAPDIIESNLSAVVDKLIWIKNR